jgi:hypothetical protein
MFNFHIFKISLSAFLAVALPFCQCAAQSSWAAETTASGDDPISSLARPVDAVAVTAETTPSVVELIYSLARPVDAVAVTSVSNQSVNDLISSLPRPVDAVAVTAETTPSVNDSISSLAAPVDAVAVPADSATKDAVTVQAQKSGTDSSPSASPSSVPDNVTSKKLFREEVQKFASPALDQNIDQLVDEAVAQSTSRKLFEAKSRHYNRPLHIAVASSKDIFELATSYKGFEQSSEAADVVLEEKIKLKSRASVAYARQHQRDLYHAKVVASMMQIAMARGLKDPNESASAEKEAVDQLTDLVGPDESAKTLQLVNEWCKNSQDTVAADSQPIVGPIKLKAESEKIMAHAVATDPVVGEIKGKLHKYNGRSNLARASAKVINIGLSAAAFTPTFISPAAQVAWCAYIVTQGGPEESKLLKEVYLAKRFESRWQMLNEESTLALNSYNTGIYTHNPTLLAFSQFMIARMSEPIVSEDAKTDAKASGALQLDVADSKPESEKPM